MSLGLSLSDAEETVLREIADLIMPFYNPLENVSVRDVLKYLRQGFERDELIERVVKEARSDPLVCVKLRLIYSKLEECYKEQSDVSPDFSEKR